MFKVRKSRSRSPQIISIAAALLPIEILGDLVSLGTATAFAIVCISVMYLRKARPDLERPFTAPFGMITPILGIVFALVMIGCLGYLVAYNNMAGATSATQEQRIDASGSQNSIEQLFSNTNANDNTSAAQPALHATQAGMADGMSLGLPKLSQTSLANADSWFWLAFASVIFFIVTTVAALYMQTVENNVRNFHIARDYSHRRRQFAQLHLLELADQQG